jgi:hypothetical protein
MPLAEGPVLAITLGLIGAAVIAVLGAARDPIGWGYLLSTDVEQVAEARLAEPVAGLPAIYFLSAVIAGIGLLLGLPEKEMLIRWAVALVFATFVLATMWDMRRRRGALAVYIRLRRGEIGFEPKGGVIEVPKLMFLVMNQPTPLVWLIAAVALAASAAALFPAHSWVAVVPLSTLAATVFWLWLRNRRSPWEPLARRLRRAGPYGSERLVVHLERALDLDPEVAMLRHEADSMVARVINDHL